MKTTKPVSILFAIAAIAAAPASHAAITNFVIDFEDPVYTTGALSGTPVPATGDGLFDGQDGWSRSSSSAAGTVFATTSSGLYTGGQAIGGNTYIGANSDYIIARNETSSFTFDLYSGNLAGERLGVGGWKDINGNGAFNQSLTPAPGEVGLLAGFNNQSGTLRFGIRGANFGTDDFVTAYSLTAETWYRLQVTFDDSTRSVTFDAWDLTNGGGVVDLNGVGEGTSWTFAGLSEANYGFPTTEYDGTAIRLSNGTLRLDNIISVPEPGSLLLGLGALGVFGVRRRR